MAIESKRYRPINVVLGRGTWGTVGLYEDVISGQRVAIKELTPGEIASIQMEQRRLTSWGVVQRESTLRAARNVLPRYMDIDDKSTPFIVMPCATSTLATILREDEPRGKRNSFVTGYPDKKWSFNLIRDIANSIAEMHEYFGRTAGDIKPENYVMDEQRRAILSDLGCATCIDPGKFSQNSRNNMGFLLTRAYECFEEGAHPDQSSDVYGAAALSYRIFAGEYPHEQEVEEILKNNSGNINELVRNYFHRAGRKRLDQIVKRRIDANVPREFRSTLYDGMRFDKSERTGTGRVFLLDIDRAIAESDPQAQTKKIVTKYLAFLFPALFIMGVLGVSGIAREFVLKDIPSPPIISRPLYSGEKENVHLDIEPAEMEKLPEIERITDKDYFECLERSKKISGDRLSSYFLTQYVLASREVFNEDCSCTEDQMRIYRAYSSGGSFPAFERNLSAVEKNLEVAFKQAKTPEGKVDLEDTYAISRLGIDTVNLARRASGSHKFWNYISAKDSSGKEIIPPQEQRFLKYWLATTYKNEGRDPEKNLKGK